MPRKRRYSSSGRPPKDPEKKVGRPVRTLVTPAVEDAIKASATRHGISSKPSGEVGVDYARLCIYRFLEKEGAITPELATDPTWAVLRGMGLV